MGFKHRSPTSPQFVAFLRAINVGGRTVKSAELCAIFEAAGLHNISTFLASGNVIFDAPATKTAAIERTIEATLMQHLGYPVVTFVRSVAQLQAVAAAQPFDQLERSATADALYVAFLREPAATDAPARLQPLRNTIDDFGVVGRHSYWLRRRGVGESRFSSAHWERALGMRCTVRNMNTIDRLIAKLV